MRHLITSILILLLALCEAKPDTQGVNRGPPAVEDDLELHLGCGFHDPTTKELQDMIADEKRMRGEKIKEAGLFWNVIEWFLCFFFRLCPSLKFREVAIDTYVHVIHKDDGTGAMSTAEVQSMVSIANEYLNGTGFSLSVKGITNTTNDVWYESESWSPEEIQMKSRLKVGSLDTLNIYTKKPIGYKDGKKIGLCGYAFRAGYAMWVGIQDGIVINPGCTSGRTLAHEVGKYDACAGL